MTGYHDYTVYIEHVYTELRNYTINVTVLNDVDSVTFARQQVLEPVLDEYITVTSSASELGVPLSLDYTITNLFHPLGFPLGMICDIDFGDGTNETHEIFLLDSYVIPHEYELWNYTMNVTLRNTISRLNVSEVEIVVQNVIHNLTLTAVDEVLWPDGPNDLDIATVQFIVTSEQVELLENMHCVSDYGTEVVDYLYVDSLDLKDTFELGIRYNRTAIGLREFSINCSNLVSEQILPHSVDVIWDQVILDTFTSADPVWRTNVSSLTLTVERFGTHSCFKFNMSDGNTLFYGRPWCASQEPSLTLIPLEHNTTVIQVNHTYTDFGVYTVTVDAFNHASSQSMQTTTVVKEWYCYTPAITFNDIFTDVSNIQQFYKSADFSIAPTSVNVDCMKSSNQSVDHWEVRPLGGGAVLATANDVRLFHHPVRMPELHYGQYEANFSVTMSPFDPATPPENVSASMVVYFEIIATPLEVSINGKPRLYTSTCESPSMRSAQKFAIFC